MSIAIQSSNELDRTVACALEQVSDDELVRSVRPREACTGTGIAQTRSSARWFTVPHFQPRDESGVLRRPPSHVRSHIDFMLTIS